jgi:uncharacterized membrane protein HdeD (DUF308 family)
MSTSVPYPSDPYPATTPPPPSAAVPAESIAESSSWRAAFWIAIGGAITSVVVGIMIMIWPDATLKVVAVLFGVWVLLHGVVRIVQAVVPSVRDGAERALLGVIGILFVMAGIIALRNLLASLAFLVTIVGLMWLIGGIVDLVAAFGRSGAGNRLPNAVLGVLSVLGALVLLLWPGLTLSALVYLTGIWMVVMGLVQVGLVLRARRSLTV